MTFSGTVECDASLMDGLGAFGSIGCCENLKNPILGAKSILTNERIGVDKNGRIAPILVTSVGVKHLCKPLGVEIVDNSMLITKKQIEKWKSYINTLLEKDKEINSNNKLSSIDDIQDTVGAIMIDEHGNVFSGDSGRFSNVI